MAAGISCVVQLTGAQTASAASRSGRCCWFGIVLPVWATEYVFEVRPGASSESNAGFWLLGMVLMGESSAAGRRSSRRHLLRRRIEGQLVVLSLARRMVTSSISSAGAITVCGTSPSNWPQTDPCPRPRRSSAEARWSRSLSLAPRTSSRLPAGVPSGLTR